MDQNNDWYERYSSNAPQDGGAHTPKRGAPRGVRLSTLIVFLLVAVLLGGLLGGLYTRQYVSDQLAALTTQQQQLTAKNALSETSNQQLRHSGSPPPPADLRAPSRKAQIIELTAPSVVGIDTYYTASGYGFPFGNGNNTNGADGNTSRCP